MDRATRIFKHDPLTVVELIMAFGGILGSVILMTVSLSKLGVIVGTGSAAVAAITSSAGIFILGGVAISYSLLNIYGVYRRSLKIRSFALFTQILVRLYALLAGFLVQGFFPPTWISSIVILLIAVVCYLTVRRKMLFYRGII
jgi:hypothetical protein